jgi:hypothetical protein
MTERTIRSLAKELAGIFYEGKRSEQFRRGGALVKAIKSMPLPDGSVCEQVVLVPFNVAYPTAKAYVAAWWPFFVDPAEKMLVNMLGLPNVSERRKSQIYDAICEHNDKRLMQGGGKYLRQRPLEIAGDQPSGR